MKENVIHLFNNEYDALEIMTIYDRLNLSSSEELRELQEVLKELEDEFIIYHTKKDKYIMYDHLPNFKKGKIQINKKGFGFVLMENEPDIHISKDNLGLAIDNDYVLAEVTDFTTYEGRIIKVLKRDLNNIIGLIKSVDNKLYFEPTNKIDIELIFNKDSFTSCVEGEIVQVHLDKQLKNNIYEASVAKHIGHKDDPMMDILTIAAKYEIFNTFPDAVINEIENIPNEVLDKDKVGRKDLTDKIIFTIDGEDTKDIDDAISIEKINGEYHLGVHIADVSYYVKENSPLDNEALIRGTSSYLANAVIPMLPHKLSNGICSLNPEVMRCAISCEMVIESNGHVKDSQIFPSLIKSRKKMTYTSVNHLLENGIVDEGYEEYKDQLLLMQELAHIIRKERTNRGASDFGTSEAKIICDEEGRAIDIKKYEQREGEKLIEDFMVAANETVASTIYRMELPGIYRVHDVPVYEKIASFISFCNQTNHPIKGKFKNINPKTFQSILNQVKEVGDPAGIYRSLAVRSMPKAYYSKDNIGHFGLASTCYTHFTSPIRRYPDLITHRLLRTYIFEGKIDNETTSYWNSNLDSIAKQTSDREIAAQEAEREVDKMKMAEYMESHVGEEYEATISGVTNFGIFVALDNLIEGLIAINTLKGDYYVYVEDAQSLIGKSTKKIYTIGDTLKVRCVRASKESSQIDFEEIKEEMKKT